MFFFHSIPVQTQRARRPYSPPRRTDDGPIPSSRTFVLWFSFDAQFVFTGLKQNGGPRLLLVFVW